VSVRSSDFERDAVVLCGFYFGLVVISSQLKGCPSFSNELPTVQKVIFKYVRPIADRMAQNLEIISETFSTNQNSAHGIYD